MAGHASPASSQGRFLITFKIERGPALHPKAGPKAGPKRDHFGGLEQVVFELTPRNVKPRRRSYQCGEFEVPISVAAGSS